MTNDDRKVAKSCKVFRCETCDHNTCNKYNYMKHLSTDKHKMMTNDDIKVAKVATAYICDCGKEYKYKQGLSVHRKKCQQLDEIINSSDEIDFKEMFFEMLTQNKELQNTIIEQNKSMQTTINEIIPKIGSNNNNIITNNTVVNNLTLLNNNCKDAISITDFIDSIEIEMKHLIHTSKKGLVSGVANIFLENYNKLPIQMRPLWCVDKKRKKMYIKEDEWSEDKDNVKTKGAIKCLTAKQAKNTGMYIKENPDWMSHDKKKEEFIKIANQTTTELDDNKQHGIINTILDNLHLSDEIKCELKVLTE